MATILSYRHNPRLLEKEYTDEEIKQALIDIGWEQPHSSPLYTTVVEDIDNVKYDESNELHMAIRIFSDPRYRVNVKDLQPQADWGNAEEALEQMRKLAKEVGIMPISPQEDTMILGRKYYVNKPNHLYDSSSPFKPEDYDIGVLIERHESLNDESYISFELENGEIRVFSLEFSCRPFIEVLV